MPRPSDLLFVYGTLHPDHAPAEIAEVVSRFAFVGSGTVCGQVYLFPQYPALRLDPRGEQVRGAIFLVPYDAWPALDEYEGYAPQAAHTPDASLFRREQTSVLLADGTRRDCWIYTYARPLPG